MKYLISTLVLFLFTQMSFAQSSLFGIDLTDQDYPKENWQLIEANSWATKSTNPYFTYVSYSEEEDVNSYIFIAPNGQQCETCGI